MNRQELLRMAPPSTEAVEVVDKLLAMFPPWPKDAQEKMAVAAEISVGMQIAAAILLMEVASEIERIKTGPEIATLFRGLFGTSITTGATYARLLSIVVEKGRVPRAKDG